ncbi:MAG: globin [Pseudomonadales bacterium]
MEDPLITSLEVAAENAGDISEEVYKRYFARCPGSEALMSHIDHLVRGKMLNEVFRLVMLPDFTAEQQYLDFEVKNHKLAYSVEPHMYRNLLSALRDVVREASGEAWDDATERAWQARIDTLIAEIEARI